jgi:fibronectin type 3 domain-containing protein
MRRNRILLIAVGAIFVATTLAMVVSAILDRPTTHSVTLTWNSPVTVEGVRFTGYNIYRGTTAGGPYVPIAFNVSERGYKDTLVSGARTYYYVVTSVDSRGHESAYSTEIRTVIP